VEQFAEGLEDVERAHFEPATTVHSGMFAVELLPARKALHAPRTPIGQAGDARSTGLGSPCSPRSYSRRALGDEGFNAAVRTHP
jgi:hypothetical protein